MNPPSRGGSKGPGITEKCYNSSGDGIDLTTHG
jgi:hypothetical protein